MLSAGDLGVGAVRLIDRGAAAGAGELRAVDDLAGRGAAAQVEGHMGRW
ncbi:hypothetical protein SCE1572_46405 [Sorangium cellulosum So0157-2]|uniref:Uncharacterized protein n=1 Tax=Sorangium cellulosum So0157-2 TaxID=1254432 RepID=S4YEJ6_SORCE|nr:hypothetical protein SCE1572_46405 [Sorangium cellulosum So0157-2]